MRISTDGGGHWLKPKASEMLHLHAEEFQVLGYMPDCL